MELLNNLSLGFEVALTPTTLSLAIIGCILGTIIGALPGLGPSNGVAILIPLSFSFNLDATQALVLMTSVYYGAMYGGRISSILLNIPGDEPAMMTTLDGYPMAKKGRAGDALVLSGFASFVGAFLGGGLTIILGFAQFGVSFELLILLLIFISGQLLESYYLTPKLVGDAIKLNPVWILFALSTGAFLSGFVGVLISLPVAAVLGVIVRYYFIKLF